MKDRAKKIIIVAILIILGFFLQTSIFPFLSINGVTPNIILVLVVSVAIMNGSMTAMIVGFICGLLIDIMYGGALGIYACFYMCLGYINGYFHVLFFAEANFSLPILVFVNELIYHILTYLVFFLPQQKWNIWFYFKKTIAIEVLYTTIISLILYQVFFKIYKLTKKQKKKKKRRQPDVL